MQDPAAAVSCDGYTSVHTKTARLYSQGLYIGSVPDARNLSNLIRKHNTSDKLSSQHKNKNVSALYNHSL